MNKNGQVGGVIGMILIGLLVLIIVGCIIAIIAYSVNYANTDGTETITVKTKWTKIIDGTEKYRITATDGQTFVVEDSLFHKQFESASLYANMNEGETYKIRTQGFRFGFLSDFKKITKVTRV